MFAFPDHRILPEHARASRPCLLESRATRVEARALSERARAARAVAGRLRAERSTAAEAIRHAVAHASALLDRRNTAPPLALVTDRARGASGRVTRRRERHAAACAVETAARRAAHADSPPAAETRWARAVVHATRTVSSVSRAGAGAGRCWSDGAWTVREIDAVAVPGSRAPRCLVFEHHVVVRRVWRYPTDWTTLDEADLLRLAQLP